MFHAQLQDRQKQFDASIAHNLIIEQLSFGPRYPGSSGHQKIIEWMKSYLIAAGWDVEKQHFSYKNELLTNIVAKKGNSDHPILLGTHFDTRRFADRDSEIVNQELPVSGANDGASGVAVLLSLLDLLMNLRKINLIGLCSLMEKIREDYQIGNGPKGLYFL